MGMFSYGGSFFELLSDDALRSGHVIVSLLREHLKIRSVLDVGCGQGGWLKVWQTQGVDDVFGIDGPYVDPNRLLIPKEKFVGADLSQRIDLNRQFDLVESLEVAEHIDISCADEFVDTIARHGKMVMFSAAIPGQGGTNHVNEQPFEFWRERFAKRGFRQFDFIRPRILKIQAVEPWYRYGTFLYVDESLVGDLPAAVKATGIDRNDTIPVLAPIIYQLRCRILSMVDPRVMTGIAAVKRRALLTKRRIFPKTM
jgi:SAM-dependent methyltransferase